MLCCCCWFVEHVQKAVAETELDVGSSRLHVINRSPCDLVLGAPFDGMQLTADLVCSLFFVLFCTEFI